MTAYVESRYLSIGGLRLFLRNEDGQLQDARYVRWTIYDLPMRRQVSGRGLAAVRRGVGEYYAPWFTDVRNGNYEIVWEYQREFNLPVERKSWPFFIVHESSYRCCPDRVCSDGTPAPGSFTFLAGSCLMDGALPLYLKDSNGFLVDAYSVNWTVCKASDGCPVSVKTAATRLGTGTYSADWRANQTGGDYYVLWEFQEAAGLPLQSERLYFTLLCAANPLSGVAEGQRAPDVHEEQYQRMRAAHRVYDSGRIVCTPSSSVLTSSCRCS